MSQLSSHSSIRGWFGVCAFVMGVSCAAIYAQTPNIVLIFTDDQQFNALAANGNSIIQTPTMDQIANQGVRFTQARAALPVCSPSRATILTGQYNQTNGVENLGNSVNASSPRMAVQLQNAGYTTGVTGKWHLGSALDQTDLGFDYYATYNSNGSYYDRNYNVNGTTVNLPPESNPGSIHIDIYAADRASDFIDQANAQSKPFFLWHNTQTPHVNGAHAWDALPANHALFPGSTFYDPGNNVNELPESWDDNLENKPEYYATIRNRDLAQNDPRYDYGDPNELADATGEYYAVIKELNDMLSPLMTKLNTTADPNNPGHVLIDNTYVIFMSDNGWLIGDHGMTSKSLPFDQAARVPMMVMGPGVDVGRVDDRQVSNVDVAPTILDMAGVSIPSAMQGESILSMLSDNGAGAGVRDTNIVEIWESTFAGNKPILAGYDGRYEVFYTYDSESSPLPSYVEIYDTLNDPWELNNLAGEMQNHPGAYQAWKDIQADIQAHRTTNIGTFSHATHTVGSGQTFTIVTTIPTPDGIADQTIPEVIAANVVAQSGATVQGEGIILGDLTVESGAQLSIGPAAVEAGFAVADFNDHSAGVLTGQTGGTGWSDAWASVDAGSGGDIDVVAGDLSPAAGTNYGLTQGPGVARHIRRTSTGASTDRRTLVADMNGEIWFSFLAKLDSDGRAGINIDGHTSFDDNRFLLRAQSGGSVLDFFVQGSPNDLADFVPTTAGLTDTQLIVGKLSLATGNDLLEWWVNPDVSLGESGLTGSADMVYSLNDRDFDEDDGIAGIQKWSVHVYSGGELDNLVISDGPDGFVDVTGGGGLFAPAATITEVGELRVNGDFTLQANTTLAMDILGLSETDRFIVDGAFDILGGTFSLTVDGSFTPAAGNVFDLIDFGSATGGFDTLDLPALAAGLRWDTDNLFVDGSLAVAAVAPGDFDEDGDVDAIDIDAYIGLLGTTVPPTDARFDLDSDNDVDIDDYVQHATTLLEWSNAGNGQSGVGTLQGDFNRDGVVSLLDLNTLGASFGNPGGWAAGDTNGDGTLSLLDLNALGTNFGVDVFVAPSAQPSVPEPVSLVLLGVGGLALIRRR